MKNIKLGPVVFSLLSEFLWALGREDGGLAPATSRTRRGRGWGAGFLSATCTPGAWGLVLRLLRCSKKGGNSTQRAEEGRRIFG